MCSGRVDPQFILEAFRRGADGVFIGGCHLGDCHYVEGNYRTQRRVILLKEFLRSMNINPERLRLEWVSASEGEKFTRVVKDFVKVLKELGPGPFNTSSQK
jgi:F420-non-reducing hydrogenase iron-sulfur subunit